MFYFYLTSEYKKLNYHRNNSPIINGHVAAVAGDQKGQSKCLKISLGTDNKWTDVAFHIKQLEEEITSRHTVF